MYKGVRNWSLVYIYRVIGVGIVIAQLLVGIAQLLRLVSDDVVIMSGHSLNPFLSFNSCIDRSNWDLHNIKPMVRRECVLIKEKGREGGVCTTPGCGPVLV